MSRCQRMMVAGVTISCIPARRSTGSVPARSMSRNATVSLPGSSGARPARPASSSRLTFSSCSTFPQVNARRNDPSVDGARIPPISAGSTPPGRPRSRSSGDEAQQIPSLTAGITCRLKALLLLEVTHCRSRVRAVDPIDRTRVRVGREQQALQAPDRVAGSTLVQVRGTRECGIERVELAPRDGPGYSVHRRGANGGLEGSQRGLGRWPEGAVYGTGTQDSSWEGRFSGRSNSGR